MFMGHAYKFFDFSISYTIVDLPLSTLYLQFMLLIPCIVALCPATLSPTNNPPCVLHFCDSVPVLVVCLVFVFVLGSVVDSCLSPFYCSHFLSSFS